MTIGWWSVFSKKKPSAVSRQPSAIQGFDRLRRAQTPWPVCIAAAALISIAGCSVTSGPIDLHLNERVSRPPVAVVLFLVDGLDRPTMLSLADKGRLPNIQSRFMRGGVCVEGAVTSMPALTYPNLVSAMTGRFPGHHGILGNQWFERSTLQIQDYLTVPTYQMAGDDFDAPTIHDILDEQFTLNIQCPARRGMDRTADNWLLTGADWLLGTYTMTDARVGSDVAWVAETANEVGKWPVFTTFYFPGVDQIGHEYGSDSRTYVNAVKNADRQIGRVIDAIERARPADRSYFALIADHGHVPLDGDRRIDIAECLEKGLGLRVRHARINHSEVAERARELKRFDAIVVRSGDRRLAIHVRGDDGWNSAPSRALIDQIVGSDGFHCGYGAKKCSGRLVDLPGVACAVTKAPNGARVVTREGEVLIERNEVDGKSRYRIANGADVLSTLTKLAPSASAAFDYSRWHSSREWLAATINSDWPDFVPQVVEMFDSPRAGDIVLFAADEWSLAPGDDGGHGSCVARDMRIPMYFAGPGLAAGGQVPCGRLVDVMPTILDLLGEAGRMAKHSPIDGLSLLPDMKQAGATSQPSRSLSDDDAQ